MTDDRMRNDRARRPFAYARTYPATVGFLGVTWLLFGVQLAVQSRFGDDVTVSLFVVRYTHLEYVWTWFTAPLGHVGPLHIVLNSWAATILGPVLEDSFGTKRSVLAFSIGGAVTAVVGTVCMVLVRVPFRADAASGAAGIGSSIGLFVLLGMLLARYPDYSPSRLPIENSTFFGLLLAIHVAGIALDVWTLRLEAAIPYANALYYHVVGLLVGGLWSRFSRSGAAWSSASWR